MINSEMSARYSGIIMILLCSNPPIIYSILCQHNNIISFESLLRQLFSLISDYESCCIAFLFRWYMCRYQSCILCVCVFSDVETMVQTDSLCSEVSTFTVTICIYNCVKCGVITKLQLPP